FPGADHADDLRGGDELHGHARLGLESGDALVGLDEEGMQAVAEPPGARRRVAQAVDRARGQAGLLEQLAPAALERILAVVPESRRQFPGERFQRRPVLPHDRYLSGAGWRDGPP